MLLYIYYEQHFKIFLTHFNIWKLFSISLFYRVILVSCVCHELATATVEVSYLLINLLIYVDIWHHCEGRNGLFSMIFSPVRRVTTHEYSHRPLFGDWFPTCKIRESADNKQEKLVNRSRRMARNLNFSEDRSYRNEHNARTSLGKLIWTQIWHFHGQEA